MKTVDKLDEAIKALSGQQNMFFVIQDWDNGMLVYKDYDNVQIKQQLEEAASKYNDRFAFRAFNENTDIYWNGDFGIICTDIDNGKSRQVMMEFDTKRHPGMMNFANLFNKNLKKEIKIEAKEIKSTNGGNFLRFIRIQEVKSHAE